MEDWRGNVTILGPAQSQGSKRLVRNRKTGATLLIEQNAKLKPWRQELITLMREQRPPYPLDCAVGVEIMIYVARPRSHYGSGRNAYVLKPSAPDLPSTGKDLDKIVRACNDAGTIAGWWCNDSRIVDLHVRRRFDDGEGERTVISAWSLIPQPHLISSGLFNQQTAFKRVS
jgi:Holliday junction resolvase RusA-like endonuclease